GTTRTLPQRQRSHDSADDGALRHRKDAGGQAPPTTAVDARWELRGFSDRPRDGESALRSSKRRNAAGVRLATSGSVARGLGVLLRAGCRADMAARDTAGGRPAARPGRSGLEHVDPLVECAGSSVHRSLVERSDFLAVARHADLL